MSLLLPSGLPIQYTAHPLFSNFCSSSSLLTSLRPTIFCTVCDSFCMTDWLLFSRCMHCKSRGSVTNGGLIHYPKYSLPPLPRSDSGCHHSQTFFFTRRYHGHQLKLIAFIRRHNSSTAGFKQVCGGSEHCQAATYRQL